MHCLLLLAPDYYSFQFIFCFVIFQKFRNKLKSLKGSKSKPENLLNVGKLSGGEGVKDVFGYSVGESGSDESVGGEIYFGGDDGDVE